MASRRSDIIVGIVLVAVVLFVFWVAFTLLRAPEDGNFAISGTGDVAVIPVEGMIADPQPFIRKLEKYLDRRDVKAIVIRIESPGGIVAASQEMYNAIKRARETDKPVIASMGSVAASGGYYIALGADSILASPGTMTGSIGVLMDFPETTKLMDKLGIQIHSVTSGPLKNAGAPYSDWDSQTRDYFQSIVMNTYEQFVQVVATERHLDQDIAHRLADGRVFTGMQALEHRLIDRLGGLYEAVQLAGEMAGIQGEPTTVQPARRQVRLWDVLFGDLNQLVNRFAGSPVPAYRYQY